VSKTVWYATRNFKGIDKNGDPCDYSRGDIVEGVERWPTFSSLKNIEWITDLIPAGVKKSSSKPKKEKEPETEVEAEVDEQDDPEEFVCDICNKVFKTSRALKVHMRYH